MKKRTALPKSQTEGRSFVQEEEIYVKKSMRDIYEGKIYMKYLL